MTDNEQRAHDLAIAAVIVMTKDGDDIYAIYNNAYNVAIKSFTRDFPDEKH